IGTDNYDSQSNRRVELLFFDENDILPDLGTAERSPADSEIYLPGIYERVVLPPNSLTGPEIDDSILIIPHIRDDGELPPEESVGLEHTLSSQTVGSTRPGQPGVRYDPQAQLLLINLNQASASSEPAPLVYFGPRF